MFAGAGNAGIVQGQHVTLLVIKMQNSLIDDSGKLNLANNNITIQ